MFSFYFVICADASKQYTPPNEVQFQTILFEKVFHEAFPNWIEALSGGEGTLQSICQSEHISGDCRVTCDDQTVKTFFLRRSYQYHIGYVNLRFFPPTMTSVCVTQCRLIVYISTRTFPKSARFVDFSENNLIGPPDLSTLPENLQELYLNNNSLCGPIDFSFLPRSIRYINLIDNKIKQNVVFYGNLPECLTHVFLGSNPIGGLYAASDGTRQNAKIIFDGMKRSKIH